MANTDSGYLVELDRMVATLAPLVRQDGRCSVTP